ncbi:MAG: PIN domain-containing protein [Treponema sp.]|uniref:PIN domain-containing protein n=1 Tax=Treponema sp. TaxID=166 RepID=UPI001DB2FFB0|nr:PIN domain-containing protein [Treponema sp.]MBS7242292.1 PIN domain-containing protein [Treponema sp.]
MILVDSNVFIEFWKNPLDNQKKVFLYNEIAICGVIKSELLRGTSSEKQFIEVFNALDCFNYLFFGESDWSELAKLFVDLRKNGISIPFQDGMIAYLAIKNNCKLWTNDKHFKLIQIVKPELQIY